MPLSIQIPYRGDQYLFQGISQAGQGIAAGIETMTQRLRQTKAMRTMAVDGMGMDPDKVDSMTPEQIQGMMQGMAVKNAQREQQMRVQMDQAHANYYNRFNQKADREDQFSSSVNDFMNNAPTTLPNGDQGPMPPPTLDPQTLLRLEAKAGTLDPDKAMQYMKQMGGGADNPMVIDKTSLPNATILKTRQGNEFQVVRENGEAPDAPPGYQMVADGKGGWKAVKVDAADLTPGDRAKFQMAHEKSIDELIKSLPFAQGDTEMTTLIKGRIASHQSAINDLNAGAPKPAAAAKGAAKKAMGGYKIGTVYAGMKYLGDDPADQNNWEKVAP